MTKTVVLLGAGASVPAGMPTARELTNLIEEDIRGADPSRFPVSPHATNCLEAVNDVLRARGTANPDFEQQLELLETLGDADAFPLRELVEEWHPAIGAARRRIIGAGDDPKWAFLNTAMEFRRSIDRILRKRPIGDVSYLAALIDRSKAEGGLCVGTLNYDEAVEEVGRRYAYPVSTGGVGFGWQPGQDVSFDRDEIRLLKMHGSITWPQFGWAAGYLFPGGDEARHSAREISAGPNKPIPSLIAGGAKLTASGPFMELLVEFRREVLEADRLVVVGYSFRDPHIDVAIRALANKSRRPGVVTIVDPYLALPSSPAFDGTLRSLLPVGIAEGVVTLIREGADTGLRKALAMP